MNEKEKLIEKRENVNRDEFNENWFVIIIKICVQKTDVEKVK